MTEPSQYFKGRTVQEQMNEVIGYVDVRAEEVAAAKADDVLEPAEQAKTDAIAAKEAAEDARDTTLAALPAVNERIDDVESDLNAVTLRVTTAEGDIVTIQGRITAVETKNSQQDSAIAALQTADAQNVKINRINDYAVGLTGDQANIAGRKDFIFAPYSKKVTRVATNITQWWKLWTMDVSGANNLRMWFVVKSGTLEANIYVAITNNGQNVQILTYGSERYAASNFKISVKDNVAVFWCKPMFSTSRIFGYSENETNVNYGSYSYWTVSEETGQYDEPTAADYDVVVTGTYDGA